ncbi:50S ribosomal protein L23 [Wolbachia endosymbiont of Howardula sp.]|uniref:50S ribosomal protein L23 n=1 Tax=Wolbachia endosymbiont of Howardula sp. TaxID=2916816 RepID=UPI00217D74F2|nr:50S ribosomal protein L23 [Wolbachia endosymbiont of Howardula sp.]UWI83168.1 50S ribosomal protein L23 [Wolbachia endosymbiont of Howardula sp.]
MIKYNSIIKSPIITEKTSFLKEKYNKYSIHVFINVNKYQIKAAIESLFKVTVSAINIVRVQSKSRRFRHIKGYEKRKQKVYFSLVSGQTLDIMSV